MAGVTQQYCGGPLTPWAHGQHLRGCGWLGSGTTFLQGTGVLEGVAPQPYLAWWGSCAVYLEGDWRNAGMKFCPTIPSRPQPDWDSGLVIQAQRPGEFSRGLVRKQGTRSHLTTNCLWPKDAHTPRSHRARVRLLRHHTCRNEHFTQVCSVAGLHSHRPMSPKKTQGRNNPSFQTSPGMHTETAGSSVTKNGIFSPISIEEMSKPKPRKGK